jgi:hypothetical protein
VAQELYWDAIYEIVLALKARYPDEDLEDVSLGDIFKWTMMSQNWLTTRSWEPFTRNGLRRSTQYDD